eukprot:358210-Chlamydomonas_euryale.AAC.1
MPAGTQIDGGGKGSEALLVRGEFALDYGRPELWVLGDMVARRGRHGCRVIAAGGYEAGRE